MPKPPPNPPPPTEPSILPMSIGEGHVVDIEVNEAGDTLILWRRHPDLMVQLYDRAAQPRTEPMLVHTETQAGAVGDATFLKGGGFVVVYEDALGGPTSFNLGLRMRRYDENGTPHRSTDQNVGDGQGRPSVSMLEDGGFVTIAQRFENQVGASPLRVHRFNEDGVPMRISDALGVDGAFPQVWGTLDGGYRVVFSSDERGGDRTLHRFDSNNIPVNRPVQLAFDVSDLVNLPDDSMVVLSEGKIRRFSKDGTPLSAWSDEIGIPEGAWGQLAVSGCAAGACVVTVLWSSRTVGPLVARMFDTNVSPIENPVSKDAQSFEVAPELEEPSRPRRIGRTSYGEFSAGGGVNGELALVWTVWESLEDGGVQQTLEGVLITP